VSDEGTEVTQDEVSESERTSADLADQAADPEAYGAPEGEPLPEIEHPPAEPEEAPRTLPTTERECAVCGDVFEGKGRAKYCSEECKDEARKEARRPPDTTVAPLPTRPGPPIQVVQRQRGASPECPKCGSGMHRNGTSTSYPPCVQTVVYWRCMRDDCNGSTKTIERK